MLCRSFFASLASRYDLSDPLLSPLDADLTGLPPLLIHVARDEARYRSGRALADRATGAGMRCEFHAVEDSVHSFVLFPFLPEAEAALQSFAVFARQTALVRAH